MSDRPNNRFAKIWGAVQRVPRGKVATYGQVAKMAGMPRRARLVGFALHALPRDSDVPWHRVINAQGRISFPPRSVPYKRQRERLEAEGVVFVRGVIRLDRYGYAGPDPSPLLD